jgi:hypothetical protein
MRDYLNVNEYSCSIEEVRAIFFENKTDENVSRIVLVLWILEIFISIQKGFDPYPFILSCFTAFRASYYDESKSGRRKKIVTGREETI